MLKLIRCDGCHEDFILLGVGVKVVRDDVWKHGFTCPYCGREYVFCYTNTGIRELQEMQKKLRESPKRNTKKTGRLINDLKERIEVGTARLKEEIENEKD